MAEAYKAADLAEELGITPAELRRHLRALEIEKPEGGWKWAKKTDPDLKEIRAALKQRLKDLASEDKPKRGRKPKAAEEPAAEDKPAKKTTKKTSRKKKTEEE